jgi:hypothetical protein
MGHASTEISGLPWTRKEGLGAHETAPHAGISAEGEGFEPSKSLHLNGLRDSSNSLILPICRFFLVDSPHSEFSRVLNTRASRRGCAGLRYQTQPPATDIDAGSILVFDRLDVTAVNSQRVTTINL